MAPSLDARAVTAKGNRTPPLDTADADDAEDEMLAELEQKERHMDTFIEYLKSLGQNIIDLSDDYVSLRAGMVNNNARLEIFEDRLAQLDNQFGNMQALKDRLDQLDTKLLKREEISKMRIDILKILAELGKKVT